MQLMIFLICSFTLLFAAAPISNPLPIKSSLPSMPSGTPSPIRVGVGFLLNSISKINESDSSYIASIDLKLNWKDPSLAFDPNEYGTFRRELNSNQAIRFLTRIWNPDVVIANMKGFPISREPCLLINSDGSVLYIQRIKGVFDTSYNLAPFPFDTEHLLVKLISNEYDTSQVEFFQGQEQIDQSGIREGVLFPGWNLLGVEYASNQIRGLDGRFFPEFEIKIGMSRQPMTHLFSFVPLLLIVIVPTILTLYASVDIGVRLTTWSGAILALIALGFSIQLRYPALPTNGILNQLVGIIFLYEFIMICMTMSVFNPSLTRRIKNPYLVSEMTQCMRWQIPVIFLAIIAVAILLTLAGG